MHFAAVFSSALALAASANAAVTAQQMTSNFDTITQLSDKGDEIAKSIGITNFFNTAPQLINQIHSIITTANGYLAADGSKRSLQARTLCPIPELPGCNEDLGETMGGNKRSGFIKVARADGFSDSEQQGLCSAYRTFTQKQQTFLTDISAKYGVLSLSPFVQPMAASLRSLEDVYDSLSFDMIDKVPTCAQDATENKNNLDTALNDVIDKYSN